MTPAARLLPRPAAAAYLGESLSAFDARRRSDPEFPPAVPDKHNSRQRWDVRDLDAYVDRLRLRGVTREELRRGEVEAGRFRFLFNGSEGAR